MKHNMMPLIVLEHMIDIVEAAQKAASNRLKPTNKERKNAVRVSPREFAERLRARIEAAQDRLQGAGQRDINGLSRAWELVDEVVEELEGSKSAKEQVQWWCCEKHKRLPPNTNWCDPQLDAAIKAYADDA